MLRLWHGSDHGGAEEKRDANVARHQFVRAYASRMEMLRRRPLLSVSVVPITSTVVDSSVGIRLSINEDPPSFNAGEWVIARSIDRWVLASAPDLKTATSGSLHYLVFQPSAFGGRNACAENKIVLGIAIQFQIPKEHPKPAGALRMHVGYTAASKFELLEARTVLSNGSIPTVPTPEAHWTFDEGTGTTAADSTGNGHTATLGTGASWTAGNIGTNAITVAGTSTGVATATGPVINTANSFTVSAWVKLASLSGYQTIVSIAGTNVAGFYLQLRGDTGTFALSRLPSDAVAAAAYAASTSAPVVGTWYHIVGVDDVSTGTLSIYVDGQLMGTAAYAGGWNATGNTLIGHGFYNGAQTDNVNGSIDDVEMFSSALSAAQVAALDQPAYYTFDDGTGATADDVTGHGNTLTLGAGATWVAGHIGSNSLAVNGSATGNATYVSPVLNTAQSFSVSAWVNLNSVSGYQTFVSIDGANTSGFYLQLSGATGTFAFSRLASDSTSAQAFRASAASAPSPGVWYNLVGVNNVATGQLMLYVNGVLQSTVSYNGGWQATGATVIGGGKFNGARVDFVNGEIDEVHFFNSPLSASAAANVPFIGTTPSSTVNIAMGSYLRNRVVQSIRRLHGRY